MFIIKIFFFVGENLRFQLLFLVLVIWFFLLIQGFLFCYSWFVVYLVSMNNSNYFVNSDNMGYVFYLFE